jgi:hypothetical protein
MGTSTTPLESKRGVKYMYTAGVDDGVPGTTPGQTPYCNLDDWDTSMTMGSPSKLYTGGYPADFKNTWPIGEGCFETPWVWAHSEFTPQQTMRGKTALYGYLYSLGKNSTPSGTGGASGSGGATGNGGNSGGGGGATGAGGTVTGKGGSGGPTGRGGSPGSGGRTPSSGGIADTAGSVAGTGGAGPGGMGGTTVPSTFKGDSPAKGCSCSMGAGQRGSDRGYWSVWLLLALGIGWRSRLRRVPRIRPQSGEATTSAATFLPNC